MTQFKLLIAEDDPNLGQILKEYLELKGYSAHLVSDGEEAMISFKQNEYDLCILDVMMPKKDGFAVAKEIRLFKPETPFVFLTAKSLQEDTLQGLKLGADDYIKKPFSMEELTLRLQAILRRSENSEIKKEQFDIGEYKFDYTKHELSYKGS